MAATSPPDAERSAVSVIGLGAMGSALARAFLDHGHLTTVWNRTAGKADALAAKGAARAATVADAAEASPLVVVCVLDRAAVLEALDGISAVMSGRTLVNLTTGTPDQARETALWAARRGADYLDGGILADPADIGMPEAFLLYGGSQGAWKRHGATLASLGGGSTFVGADAGLAALHHMALIGVGYETWIGYLHTLALVAAENVDPAAFAPYVTGMFSASTELLTGMARAAAHHSHPPEGGPLSVHAALMNDLIATRRARGIDAERLEHVKALMDRRIAEGHGGEGFSSLIEAIRP